MTIHPITNVTFGLYLLIIRDDKTGNSKAPPGTLTIATLPLNFSVSSSFRYPLSKLSLIDKLNPSVMVLEKGLSHNAIGSFAGISRETVTRLISELKLSNIIWSSESGNLEMNIEKVYKELKSLLNN